MTTGLPVSRVIAVSVSLTQQAAQFANINSLLIIGDSDVIDVQTRIVSYSSLPAIATAFGTSSPEYLAAAGFFSAKPQPTQVYIGKWAQAATAGRLIGAPLTSAQAALANFTAVTSGSLKLAIDGQAATTLTGLNFSAVTNLNGVASIVTAALTGATCVWDGTEFVIKSSTTGTSSAVAFPTTPASGTNIAGLMSLNSTNGARSVAGIIAETAAAALAVIDALPTYWYGVMFASTHIVDADHQAIAAYIEADTLGPHLYGVTTQNAAALDPTQSTDIGAVLKAAGYQRTFVHYSSTDPYAVAREFGRLVTVNYEGSNTTINMMWQQLPGLIPETLTSAQAQALDAKGYNYSAMYANGVAILNNGWCAGGNYIDEMTGTDWFANYVQTNLFNLFAQAGTKIPQTDDGVHLLLTNVEASCAQAVANGLAAAGTWTQPGFGQIAQGDYLPKGFYVYAPPIASQASADRQARKAPVLQTALKLAGAIDSADVVVTVNR